MKVKTITYLFVLIFLSNSQLWAQTSASKVEEYKKAVAISQQSGDPVLASFYLSELGIIYWRDKQYIEAIDKFNQAVEINLAINNYTTAIKNYSNIGMIYSEMQQPASALKFFEKSLEVSRQLSDARLITISLIDVANALNRLGRYKHSLLRLEEALVYCRQLNDPRLFRSAYEVMSRDYAELNDKENYQKFYNLYLSYQRILDDAHKKEQEERQRRLFEEEKRRTDELKKLQEINVLTIQQKELILKYTQDTLAMQDELIRLKNMEQEKIEAQNKLQQAELDKQKAVSEQQELRLARERLVNISILVGLVLAAVIAVIAVRGYRINKRANKLLAFQNEEISRQRDDIKRKSEDLEVAMEKINEQNINITKSINYAKRIQKSMMPRQELLQSYLPDSFILLKPRDIVSGDFYYFTHLNGQLNGRPGTAYRKDETQKASHKFIISAVDCTGHGVPGAFMSMIGYNLLEEITHRGVTQPHEILNQLHLGIKNALKQDVTENRDGMDMALCTFDPDTKTLEFAGAKNPLLIVRDGEMQLVRGDKYPIGGIQTDEEFSYSPFSLLIDRATCCYIFSDGYADQFGGDMGRKFLSRNLYDLIHSIHTLPMQEQRRILNDRIEEWRGTEYKQIDDILIMGFRLDEHSMQQLVTPVHPA